MRLISWNVNGIRAVWKKGFSLSQLARDNGMTPTAFSVALRRPVKRAEAVIAACIGISPQKIWPDRYDATGRRLVRKGGMIKRTAT